MLLDAMTIKLNKASLYISDIGDEKVVLGFHSNKIGNYLAPDGETRKGEYIPDEPIRVRSTLKRIVGLYIALSMFNYIKKWTIYDEADLSIKFSIFTTSKNPKIIGLQAVNEIERVAIVNYISHKRYEYPYLLYSLRKFLSQYNKIDFSIGNMYKNGKLLMSYHKDTQDLVLSVESEDMEKTIMLSRDDFIDIKEISKMYALHNQCPDYSGSDITVTQEKLVICGMDFSTYILKCFDIILGI